MSGKSPIEWTDATWTPLRVKVRADARQVARAKGYASLLPIIHPGRVGPHCERVHRRCRRCYSETNNGRCLPSNGTGIPFDRRARDLVEPFVDERILLEPLRWKKPRMVFVCSQTDLFGEWWREEMIDRIMAVVALCPQHTFQVLTKRAGRAVTYFGEGINVRQRIETVAQNIWWSLPPRSRGLDDRSFTPLTNREHWPLPNLWVGVSAEEQVAELMRIPAAVRFLSAEPLLGPLSLRWAVWDDGSPHPRRARQLPDVIRDGRTLAGCHDHLDGLRMLDWVIVGGESGSKARTCDLRWIRSIVGECKEAGVPCFVKQLGARPSLSMRDYDTGAMISIPGRLRDRKGGDPGEWPADLRVRQMPKEALLNA